jgi:hypothetical protein
MNLYRQEYQIGDRRASPPPLQIELFVEDLPGSPHTPFRTAMYLMVVEHAIVWCLDRVENVCSKETSLLKYMDTTCVYSAATGLGCYPRVCHIFVYRFNNFL